MDSFDKKESKENKNAVNNAYEENYEIIRQF